MRWDVVVRVWGNESNLTKAAYEMINLNSEGGEKIVVQIVGGEPKEFDSIRKLKDRIIQLKITNENDSELQCLLGAFTNQIGAMKEALVIQEMNKMVK